MAGDWIKLQTSVFEAPEVLSIADSLNLHPSHVVGCLARIWAWVDQHSEDGNALNVTRVTLEKLCGVPGFADAMLSTGWLAGTDGNLSFPNFDRHNGKTAKNRALTASRVARHRERASNAEVTQGALAREEKRRDIYPPTPQRGVGGKKPPEKTQRANGAWRSSEDGVKAKAMEVGVGEARPGEDWQAYIQRVANAVDASARSVSA